MKKYELLKLESMTLFERFGKIFIELIEHRSKQTIDNPKESKVVYYQQEFIKRYFENFLAIKSIYAGIYLNTDRKEYFICLLPAVMTLLRSCLENYALYYYIYIDPRSTEEILFRFKCWWREGFIRRQEFLTEEAHLQQKKRRRKRND